MNSTFQVNRGTGVRCYLCKQKDDFSIATASALGIIRISYPLRFHSAFVPIWASRSTAAQQPHCLKPTIAGCALSAFSIASAISAHPNCGPVILYCPDRKRDAQADVSTEILCSLAHAAYSGSLRHRRSKRIPSSRNTHVRPSYNQLRELCFRLSKTTTAPPGVLVHSTFTTPMFS